MGKKQKKKNQQVTAEPDAVMMEEPAPARVEVIEEPTESATSFFRAEDWFAALATTLFSGLIFFHHMAPEVTLQDSGELVTGSFTLGVPHPPGYPLWAFLGYIWSHLVVPFGNPAWRIGTMSVATGACAVGVLTMMMTRSTRLLLHSLPWENGIEERLQRLIALAVGISTGLLFGFNRGVWLWACVSEMRVLNVFSFILIGCMFLVWTVQPERRAYLYATIFFFGLSMANHQTIAVMALPLVVGTLAVGITKLTETPTVPAKKGDIARLIMTSLSDFWELAAAVLFSAAVVLLVFVYLRNDIKPFMIRDPFFTYALCAFAAGLALMVAGSLTGCWKIRRILACTGLFVGGIAFYLYMPLAAWTNPPMNWGYAGTREGFLHAITRGQYEKMQPFNVFSGDFFTKINVFTQALFNQYSFLSLFGLVMLVAAVILLARRKSVFKWIPAAWGGFFVASIAVLLLLRSFLKIKGEFYLVIFWAAVMALVACLLVGVWLSLKPRGRAWMIFAWTAFLAASLGLLTIINPRVDRQEQEITIKFFAPAHGFYAMLIGYGIAMALGALAWLWPKRSKVVTPLLCAALLAAPLVTYRCNWSLCALGGYDFGYLFGYLMFEPGGGYPPMEKNAVLYGGTDPGRFVPTYMIFCESRVAPKNRFRNKDFDRSDVYIITQNALADGTYMNYIRDHYDFSRPKGDKFLQRLLHRDHTYPQEPISIPSPQDTQAAFGQYADDVRMGRIQPGADVKVEDGRVSVSGVQGVMTINGILAQWIFEKNKDKHAFYVEESYVLHWMYPYLRPAGIIMKIEKNVLPSPQEKPELWKEIVTRDRAYWDNLTTEFTNRTDFVRNNDARKSFSKLRSAIAGLYAYRRMFDEAEYAFKQALSLCKESPEANFRLADLYMMLRRYDDAQKLIQDYQKIDIYNPGPQGYLDNISRIRKLTGRLQEIQKKVDEAKGHMDIRTALELAQIYQQLGMDEPFQKLTKDILSYTNVQPNVYLAVAQLYSSGKRWNLLEMALQRYLQFDAANYKYWIELAFTQFLQNKPAEAKISMIQAIKSGGEAARVIFRKDPRFAPLQRIPEFQSFLAPPQSSEILPPSIFGPDL